MEMISLLSESIALSYVMLTNVLNVEKADATTVNSQEMELVLYNSVEVAQGNQGVWCSALLGCRIMAKQENV